MATELTPEFDLGPLSWVQGEIDQALTRGLDALALFRANPGDATTLKHARAHVHQAAGAIQMVGLDAVVAFTDELERQLARLEELPPAEAAAGCDVVDRACRKLKIFLDELVNGAPPMPLKLYPEYEAMQSARGVKAAAPTDLFYPDLSPRAPRIAPREALPPNRLPSYLVKQRRLYQRGLLAWLRGDEGGAATMRDAIVGDRGRDDAERPARVLVDGGRAVRRPGRERPRRRLRREAARRADRPPDPARLRRQREGRRPAAPRSAVLRRDLRARRAAGAGGAARVQAVRPHSVRRGAVGRRRAAAAAAARGARAARRREGRVAEGGVRPRGKPFEAEADARVGAREGGRDPQRRADEAHGRAGRAAREDAVVRRFGTGRDGVRDGAAARGVGVRELLQPVAGLPEAGRRDAGAAGCRAPGPAVGGRRRADAGRDEQARAGARAARAGGARDPGQPAAHGAGARRVLPRQQQARRTRRAGEGQRADPRRAAHPGPRRRRPPARDVRRADRGVRRPRGRGQQRRPRNAGGVALRTRFLHRGGRAAASRARSPDRAADREAAGRSAGARGTGRRTPSKRRSPSCARRCRSSSTNCIRRRPTPRRATA